MKLKLSTLLIATALASPAIGMTLNPRGSGQVLLYPYYTVNKQQQTIISVSNTTSHGKALKVRFREGYDGREVLEFNLFLSAYDTWSGTVFSLSDASLPGTGAAILVVDQSCTYGDILTVSPKLPDGRAYQPFLNAGYTSANSDTGPTDDTRTREGYIEIFEMAELTGDTLAAITPVIGVPANCGAVQADPPASDLTPPGGGVVGTEAIVNVSQGTFFPTNAYAIDGFTNQVQSFASTDSPNLSDGSISSSGFVSAYIPLNGVYVTLNYPPDQSIDAVSALFMADQIYGGFEISPSTGASTDWVITFPTKRFYVDPSINTTQVFAPFEALFGDPNAGRSDVHIDYATYDRSGTPLSYGPLGITPSIPAVTAGPLPNSTQVGSFTAFGNVGLNSSNVLGSKLVVPFQASDAVNLATDGNAVVGLSGQQVHQLRPTADGIVVNGLPVMGFAAVNYINENVTPGVLANYSGTYPLHTSVSCSSTGSNSATGCSP